jgi:hypothetical protein
VATPELEYLNWWRSRASTKLDWQADRFRRYAEYFDGEQEVPSVRMSSEERDVFRNFRRLAHANWTELIVNAVNERLKIVGFRVLGGAGPAWEIWEASGMDADAELVNRDGLVGGSGFAFVQQGEERVEITAESPEECVVLYEPGSRRRRAAGFKRFATEGDWWEVRQDGREEWLILPEVIAIWRGPEEEPELVDNPSGVIGLVELNPQPRTKGAPRSELKSAIPIQDRVDTILWNRLVALDYSAFRQVWASGVKLAREVIGQNEQTGEPEVKLRPPFDIGPNRLLIAEDPAARFGAIPESALGGYLAAVEQDIETLAAITQTPSHYLLGKMVNLSADAIMAAEAGLVAKVSTRAAHLGEGWEEVIRTALHLAAEPGAADPELEVIWADFATRSEGQRVDALVKMATLGVPQEVLWEKWGASPQEVARWRQLLAEDQARQAAAASAALGPESIARILTGQGGQPGGATGGSP